MYNLEVIGKLQTMSETSVQVKITLSDPDLKDEELQDAVQNLQWELQEVQGITDAEFIPVEQAPPNSKGIGGFLLGGLKALVKLKHLKTLINFLGQNLFGKTVKIEVEGNGKKLKLELNRPEDIDKVMPQLENFING